jgi:hypothetical protein
MSKRKTKKRGIPKKFDPLIAKLPDGIQEQRPLIFEPRGEKKMSVVLLDFMEPLLEFWETEEELNNMLQFGVSAWNAALLPPQELAECISKTLEGIPFLQRWRMKAAFMKMVSRKQQLFADNRRMIIDYHLRITRDGPHVSVVSTVVQ